MLSMANELSLTKMSKVTFNFLGLFEKELTMELMRGRPKNERAYGFQLAAFLKLC